MGLRLFCSMKDLVQIGIAFSCMHILQKMRSNFAVELKKIVLLALVLLLFSIAMRA